MSGNGQHLVYPAREKLDEIRALLGIVPPPGKRCLKCGQTRESYDHPCTLCGDRPVAAENLVRAIREIVSPTKAGFHYEETHEQHARARREAGCLETVAPIGIRGARL